MLCTNLTHGQDHLFYHKLSMCSPVVRVALFAAISSHIFANAGLCQCELNLNLCCLILKTGFEMAGGNSRTQDAIIDDIPWTMATVLRQFNLNPLLTILAICPTAKCQATYQPTVVSDLVPPCYPSKCSHQHHPSDNTCSTALLQVNPQDIVVPVRPMPLWHLKEYLGMLFL
jgi:hypothetical protein